MRWFKHMTSSWDDEKLSQLVDKAGLEGYGFWWRIVEIVGTKLDEKNDTSVTFPLKKWGSLLGLSPKKFQTLAELCSNFGILQAHIDKSGCTINIPNLLKFRDEYTDKKAKKSGQCRDKVPPSRARSSETETELDINTPPKAPPAEKQPSTPAPSSKKMQDGGNEVIHGTDLEHEAPGVEFIELRELYDREGVPEAPLAGHIEYKTLKKRKQWPGLGRITQALQEFSEQDDKWQRGYKPNLSRFLIEQWWLKKPEVAKAREPTGGYKTAAEKRSENVSNMIAMVKRAQEMQLHGDTSKNNRIFGEIGCDV